MSFRKTIFWLHLLAGVIAGIVILVMSVTGVALAFEKEIVAWSERKIRNVTPPTSDAKALPMEELLARAQEARPGERPSAITVDSDPNIAILVSFGRTNAFYVNPYSGEMQAQTENNVRAFMHVMIDWHRYLGGHDESRARGKAITGACNAAFLFLAVSGLYLWWPRKWTNRIFRAIGIMNFKLRGKPRDWNWHNAVGFWTAPVLIVLTATAMPISYPWATNLIYKLTGSPVPTQGGPPGSGAPAIEVPTPPPGTRPLPVGALFAAAQKEFPQWKQIVQRAAGPGGGARGGGRPGGAANAAPAEAAAATNRTETAAGENREGRPHGEGREGRGGEGRESRPAQPVTLTVIEKGTWPLFANTQVTLDPFTGAVLRKEGFSDFNLGRQVRSWTRFLHTGEALGKPGKLVAMIASAGGALLVWTGFALAWRRFFSRKDKTELTAESVAQVVAKE